jgi:transposase
MVDNVLGLDVSKDTLDAYLLCGQRGRHRHVENNPAGLHTLVTWLQSQPTPPTWACCEATGTYHVACARALHEAGFAVSVVNPACVKGYAQSELSRTKTDRVDARLIARYAQQAQLRPWQPEPPEIVSLRALQHRRESLEKVHTQELNRIQAPELPACVRASCQRLLAAIEQEQAEIEAQLQALFAAHASLRRQQELLDTIPGFGAQTAAAVAAVLLSRPFSRARQLAAYSGLTPRERRSGTSVRGPARISKQGPGFLRKTLYWPAIVAIRVESPQIMPLVTGMRARGRTKMQIICAVMRKLLHTAFGVLKSQRPFDPTYHLQRA